MGQHTWEQEALSTYPVKLTDEQRRRIAEAVPELAKHFDDIEHICSGFLYWQSVYRTRPNQAAAKAFYNGKGKNPEGYIAKLRAHLKANCELMKIIDEMSPWLATPQDRAVFKGLKAANADILLAIERAEEKGKTFPHNKSQNFHYYYLAMALCDLCFEATGRKVGRSNPTDGYYGPFESSSIADIIEILDSVLEPSGTCKGYIKKCIHTRKVITDLEQS